MGLNQTKPLGLRNFAEKARSDRFVVVTNIYVIFVPFCGVIGSDIRETSPSRNRGLRRPWNSEVLWAFFFAQKWRGGTGQ